MTGIGEAAGQTNFRDRLLTVKKHFAGHMDPVMPDIADRRGIQVLSKIALDFPVTDTDLFCQICQSDGFVVMFMYVVKHCPGPVGVNDNVSSFRQQLLIIFINIVKRF